MSKYSEKKERQALAALAEIEAEKKAAEAEMAKKAAKPMPPPPPPTTPAPSTAETERIAFSRRRAKDADILRILEGAYKIVVEQIDEVAKLKEECKAEEKSHYYAAFGRLVASRDKLAGAIANIKMADAVASVGGVK